MWTPKFLKFGHVGPVDSFVFRLYRASDNFQLHGAQLSPGQLTKVGDTYSLELAAHAFVPGSNLIPDHQDLYMTVGANLGSDSSGVAMSPIFQFQLFVETPYDLVFE